MEEKKQGKISSLLFKLSDPFERKLFILVGLVGVVASLVSGIVYILLPEHFTTGIFCFIAGILSALLLVYVKKTEKYVLGYLIAIFAVFMGVFTVLFFLQGANSGYLLLMGLVFTCMLLHGKLLAIVLAIQSTWYFLVFAYTYLHPELIHDNSAADKNFLMLVLGCLGVGAIICSSLRVYVNACRKAQIIAEEALKKADEANHAKDRFLANMSHEIRTPINTILGMSDMISRENTVQSIDDYAIDIKKAGEELLGLIDDILDYSRMEVGKETVVETTYLTQSLFHKWEYTLKNLASQKGLAFYMDVDKDIPEYLYGDEGKINRIVLNLISNAVKYTDFGSVTISVICDYTSDDTISFTVKVKDTGHGIMKSDLNILFDSFERLDVVKNRHIKGTGLGLAISKELAQLMHGTIHCESEYEKGSEFTLNLPQKLGKAEEAELDAADSILIHKSFLAPDASILVVDDNESNRNVIGLLLKRTKVRIDMAESGFEALSRFKTNHYDAVLMDYRMSNMDGIEAMQRIRVIDENEGKHTPIIAMTADIVGDIEEKLLDAGFDAFLSKPVNEVKLDRILMNLLDEELITEITIDELEKSAKDATEEVIPNNLSIMIVDDEPAMRTIAGNILKGAGYNLTACKSGEECIELLSKEEDVCEERPELILLDINMPGLNGYDTFQRIRQISGLEYIPIIFMTSESSIEAEIMGMELGASDFIIKPFVRDIMLARIANQISRWIKLRDELTKPLEEANYDTQKLAIMQEQLTPTEFLIGKLMADGFTNKEIAEKTNYSYAYVKKVGNIIFDKLDISKRNEIREFYK